MKTEKNNDGNLLDRVIINFTEDQKALEEQSTLIEDAKSYKNEIKDRLKDSRHDLVTLMKYATDEQIKQINELGIDLEDASRMTNPVATLAIEILEKQEKGSMTNEALYEAYVKTFKSPDDAFTYTEFNIKCRSLFNSMRLIREEPTDASSSREHIIKINGFRPKKK